MMGAKTKINWCDATWSPITGCSPVSEGCAHCYAARIAKRFPHIVGGDFRVRFHPDRLDTPRSWKKPKRIFVCSMGDLFHDDVKPDWVHDICNTMLECPQHTFMVLTKRPENIMTKLPSDWGTACGGVLQNLWLGVSVENQETAIDRYRDLWRIFTFRKFISFEPLLGPIDLRKVCGLYPYDLHWVVVGRETGPGARPMELDWVRSIRDQCQVAGVPFFYKGSPVLDGYSYQQWPEGK